MLCWYCYELLFLIHDNNIQILIIIFVNDLFYCSSIKWIFQSCMSTVNNFMLLGSQVKKLFMNWSLFCLLIPFRKTSVRVTRRCRGCHGLFSIFPIHNECKHAEVLFVLIPPPLIWRGVYWNHHGCRLSVDQNLSGGVPHW